LYVSSLQVPSSTNGLLDALLEAWKPERRQLFLPSNIQVDMICWKLCGSADRFLRVFDDIRGHIVACPSAFVAAYLMKIMARRCKLVDARTPRRRQETREANSIPCSTWILPLRITDTL
jgi:hypothetical protein